MGKLNCIEGGNVVATKKATKAPAIPLRDVMSALDRKDEQFYNNLSDEQKKAFSAWMMMRYASSYEGSLATHYMYLVNELVNKNFSDVSKHPELQWLLLAACGSGKVGRHTYLKPPNARKKKNKVHDFIATLYPSYKSEDIEMLVNINTVDELKQLAVDYGYADKEIKEIFGK